MQALQWANPYPVKLRYTFQSTSSPNLDWSRP
jgi:hypothetical protein